MFLCIYAGAVIAALLLTIVLTNVYLTRNLFRHISELLDTLTAATRPARCRGAAAASALPW